MAELLVRVIDKIGDDLYLDTQCTKRGDVIVVCPDGWTWGILEKSSPSWRIIKTKMTVDEAEIYLLPQKDADPKNPSRTLLIRALKFDLDNPVIPADIKSAVDGPRVSSIIDVKDFDITTVKVVKESVADPAVIGPVGGII